MPTIDNWRALREAASPNATTEVRIRGLDLDAIRSLLDERDRLAAEVEAMRADAGRLAYLAQTERATTSSKWLVQVVSVNGDIHTAYFSEPPTGKPATIYSGKLEALRAAIDAAMKGKP